MISIRSPHTQALLWIVLVTIGMTLPADVLPPISGGWLPALLDGWVDKFEHLVAFMVMVILAFRSLRVSGWVERPLLTAVAVTFGYAVCLEILQIPHPSRDWAPADILADAIGIMLPVPFLNR